MHVCKHVCVNSFMNVAYTLSLVGCSSSNSVFDNIQSVIRLYCIKQCSLFKALQLYFVRNRSKLTKKNIKNNI